ncbi:hypothetical protein K435DRAFT_654060 [Dendrothele bispora CBS 962.96]|uniref:Uncharacterized protein n=1 Tax=Dendrothele bispora (strain CBS 962.96) TaxID=1314807 RepID=A0A4S8MHI0_DENBC|nr:hypothetical protein K435DRAFT_654060 [Dendrothele bispora CBS 962.96]
MSNNQNAEPQLVAEMLAAFYTINSTRREQGKDPLDSKVIPGIAMRGIVPIFYLLDVTRELVDALQAGSYPTRETVLRRCIPPVQSVADYRQVGILVLDNRKVVLKCYEAFKKFLVRN